MADITIDQLKQLNNLAWQYWWADSQQFKDFVNTKMWAWSYDKLKSWLQGIKSAWWVDAYNKQQNTPITNEVVNNNSIWQWQTVNTPIVDNKVNTEAKTQDINNATTTNITPKPNEVPNLETPKYQQQIDKFLETWDFASIRNKLKEWLDSKQIDKATFDKAEGYIWQKIQDQSKIWNDENSMFQLLKNWQKIQDQFSNTPEAIKAKVKFNVYNKYSNAWVDSIYSWLLNGDIPNELQNDLQSNPNFSIAKEKYHKKLSVDNTNSQMSSIHNVMDWKENQTKDSLTDLSNKLYNVLLNMWKTETDLVSFKDYMAKNYPDIVSKSTELNAKSKQLKELQDAADWRLKDIIKNYPWLTKGSAIALASKQNESIYEQMKTLQYDITELSSNIQFQTTQANQDYDFMREQQAKKDQLAQEQRGYLFNYLQWEQAYQRWLAQEESNQAYQTQADLRNFEQQKEIMALQQSYTNKNIPTSIMQVWWKNVLINTQTWETIKSFDLPTETTKTTESYELKEIWGKTYKFNQVTWEYEILWWETTSSVPPSWNYTNINYKMSSWTNKLIKVDSVAKDNLMNALNTIWNWLIIWDSFRDSARQTAIYKELNAKWVPVSKPWTSKHEKWLAIDIYSGKNAKWQLLAPTKEQVAVMNANWWFQTAWEDDKWHFEYLWKQKQPNWKQYTEWDIELLSELANMDASARNTALKNSWITLKQVTDYTNLAKQWKIPTTSSQKKSAIWVMDDIKNLVNMTDWQDAVWKSTIFPTIPWWDASSAENAISNLVAKLTLPNLWLLKWPMSDKDIEFIKATSNKLQLTNSDEQFSKNLVDLYNINAKINWLPEVKTIDEIKSWIWNNATNYLKSLWY